MAATKARTLNVPCPRCGECGAVGVDLNNLNTFHCGDCDADFDREDLDNLIAKWTRALQWIDAAPIEE